MKRTPCAHREECAWHTPTDSFTRWRRRLLLMFRRQTFVRCQKRCQWVLGPPQPFPLFHLSHRTGRRCSHHMVASFFRTHSQSLKSHPVNVTYYYRWYYNQVQTVITSGSVHCCSSRCGSEWQMTRTICDRRWLANVIRMDQLTRNLMRVVGYHITTLSTEFVNTRSVDLLSRG